MHNIISAVQIIQTVFIYTYNNTCTIVSLVPRLPRNFEAAVPDCLLPIERGSLGTRLYNSSFLLRTHLSLDVGSTFILAPPFIFHSERAFESSKSTSLACKYKTIYWSFPYILQNYSVVLLPIIVNSHPCAVYKNIIFIILGPNKLI